ncbi:MAG: tetratricopeptide repeat protein [Burkholderiales bacterium]
MTQYIAFTCSDGQELRVREKALGPGHPLVGRTLNNLANLFAEQGRGAEAERLYRRAITISEEAPDERLLATTLDNWAQLRVDRREY